MQSIMAWTIRIILWLQQASPLLDRPFRVLTALGDAPFIFALIFFVYWNVSRRTGAWLIILFLVSTSLNLSAKVLFSQPRPYMMDSRVLELVSAGGGGMPSGHTQTVTVIWLYLARLYRKRWLWWLAGAMLILVPLSRLYLGVHYPTDLIGGYLLGVVLLAVWRFEARVGAWLAAHAVYWWLLYLLALPVLAMLSVAYGEYANFVLGAGSGFCLGLVVARYRLTNAGTGTIWTKGIRTVVGIAPALLLLPVGSTMLLAVLHGSLLGFIYATLFGLWVALGVPWLSQRVHSFLVTQGTA